MPAQPTRSLDVDDLMRKYWPQDGPYTLEDVLSATLLLAELPGYLNHALLNANTAVLPHPAEAARVVSRIKDAVSRLDQTLDLVSSRCSAWMADDVLVTGHDRVPATSTLREARTELRQARHGLADADGELGRVLVLLNRLYYREDS